VPLSEVLITCNKSFKSETRSGTRHLIGSHSDFSCSFEDKTESGLGQMYITKNLICFAGSFNQQLKVSFRPIFSTFLVSLTLFQQRIIKLTEVKEITKRMLRVEVFLHSGDMITFKGLVSVGSCFTVLTELLHSTKVRSVII